MTICASHFAFFNFPPYRAPHVTGNHSTYITTLLTPDMIELEYDGIGLSAVEARVNRKVLQDSRSVKPRVPLLIHIPPRIVLHRICRIVAL